jgi:hypothetical protein
MPHFELLSDREQQAMSRTGMLNKQIAARWGAGATCSCQNERMRDIAARMRGAATKVGTMSAL